MSMMEIPEGKLCDDCKRNPATIIFSESVLEYSHGFSPMICAECYIERVIAHHTTTSKNLYKLLRKAVGQGKITADDILGNR